MMDYCYFNLTKSALRTVFGSLSCLAIMSSCTDSYKLDDDGVSPGMTSIYAQLSEPDQAKLTGTFKYYLRLVDDLGYAETLQRTGSKTVFPANDEAFERFFANNTMGVGKYEDLTESQKKFLLYGSMLDNAILSNMLSNVSNGATDVTRGRALKHNTALSVIDSIQHIYNVTGMPANNSYWEKHYRTGINLVNDGTQPMMVHFTQSQMTGNGITVAGADNDFQIITGKPYQDGALYIFRNPVVNSDISCLNGYIHQLQDVLVPPSNLADVLRNNEDSRYFSRMLDRFSIPVFNQAITNNYNDYALANGKELIDSIYERRYFSSRSQGGNAYVTTDPKDRLAPAFAYPLSFDPGWNGYYPNGATNLSDMGTIFVPTDEAMKKYFLPGGEGSFIIDQFGKQPNTEEFLAENIDSIRIDVVQTFLNNLMKNSFIASVPSKFGSVLNDASEPMGLSTQILSTKGDGSYDVKIANNGVAYMLNTVIAPDQYQSVYSPALFADNMRIMLSAINDGKNNSSPLNLNLNYYAYLLAMKACYALFIPTDDAFGQYYIDPTRLGSDQPRALKFYPAAQTSGHNSLVYCSAWAYNPNTHEVGDSIGEVGIADFTTQLTDILNYHTIVLPQGATFGSNRYYKTKHGGEIYFDGNSVASGAQIENVRPVSGVEKKYQEKNGVTYVLNHVIEAPQQSVYDVIANSPQFSQFFELCTDERMDQLMEWSSEKFVGNSTVTNKPKTAPYHVFVANNGLTDNVNYFNSYNYTFYVPDNDAMDKAHELGLPSWDDVYKVFEPYEDMEFDPEYPDPEYSAARDKVLAMIEAINAFIRYHIQSVSIYVDNTVMSDNLTVLNTAQGEEFNTAYSSDLGVKQRLRLTGGNNQFTVHDASGQAVTIKENGLMCNKMTRDYVLNALPASATRINTSSFAVVHEINTPLIYSKDGRFDSTWTGANAAKKLAGFRQDFDNRLSKRY